MAFCIMTGDPSLNFDDEDLQFEFERAEINLRLEFYDKTVKKYGYYAGNQNKFLKNLKNFNDFDDLTDVKLYHNWLKVKEDETKLNIFLEQSRKNIRNRSRRNWF